MPLEKLLTIESSFVLTGLGVQGKAPAVPRRRFTLHTALAVELHFADGSATAATASVEEVTRAAPNTGDAPQLKQPCCLSCPSRWNCLPAPKSGYSRHRLLHGDL